MNTHSTSYIRGSLRSQFGLSCRATAWVEDTHYGVKLGRKAQEHISRNGGAPSASALAAFAFLAALPLAASAQEEAFLDECAEARNAAVAWDEMSALELCNPAAHRAAIEELSAAEDEWWQSEGKYEEELEERGETKYYHYENAARGRQGRRELSAREYMGA